MSPVQSAGGAFHHSNVTFDSHDFMKSVPLEFEKQNKRVVSFRFLFIETPNVFPLFNFFFRFFKGFSRRMDASARRAARKEDADDASAGAQVKLDCTRAPIVPLSGGELIMMLRILGSRHGKKRPGDKGLVSLL